MLYLIGGVGRTGKSILAQRLVSQRPMLWTSTDLIQWALHVNAPEVGVHMGLAGDVQEAAFRPFLKSICLGQVYHQEDSVIEGHVIHPHFVLELINEGVEVRSCFLGWSHIDQDVFMANQGRNAWILRRDETEQQAIIDAIVPESTAFKNECQIHDFSFVDMAEGPFGQRIEYALRLLLA